jgi:hypothetical protein
VFFNAPLLIAPDAAHSQAEPRFYGLGQTATGRRRFVVFTLREDGCKASCVDWYGNARPLFLRGRIFALLGYELVEGAASGGVMRELRRASFAPVARTTMRD